MTYRVPTGPERLLMADFLKALEQGDTRAVLQTPAVEQKAHTLGEVLAAAAADKENGPFLIACLVRAVQHGLMSTDPTTRFSVMAEAANIARLVFDAQAPKPIAISAEADADADDDSPADAEEAFARAAAFSGACFPIVRRGAL